MASFYRNVNEPRLPSRPVEAQSSVGLFLVVFICQIVMAHRRTLRSLPRADWHAFRTYSPLLFGLLNIRSLHYKVEDVLDILRDFDLDIILLTETWHNLDSTCMSRLRNVGLCVAECSRPHSNIRKYVYCTVARESESDAYQVWQLKLLALRQI